MDFQVGWRIPKWHNLAERSVSSLKKMKYFKNKQCHISPSSSIAKVYDLEENNQNYKDPE